jgi:GntR family transcriptional regulator
METQHLFQRLQTELAKMISEVAPGERLPSEPLLSRQLGVSRATLREAMRTFESQGLIRRKQGLGTFVVSHSHVFESGLEVLESIETLARRTGLDVCMGELSIEDIQAGEEAAGVFTLPAGTPLVEIKRIILAESRPVAYLWDTLPQKFLSPGELQQNFTGSVLDLLIRREGDHFSHSLTEIQSVAAPSHIARALQIQRGDVLLLFIARLFDINQQVVDYSFSYFLPGYFRFQVVRSLNGFQKNT